MFSVSNFIITIWTSLMKSCVNPRDVAEDHDVGKNHHTRYGEQHEVEAGTNSREWEQESRQPLRKHDTLGENTALLLAHPQGSPVGVTDVSYKTRSLKEIAASFAVIHESDDMERLLDIALQQQQSTEYDGSILKIADLTNCALLKLQSIIIQFQKDQAHNELDEILENHMIKPPSSIEGSDTTSTMSRSTFDAITQIHKRPLMDMYRLIETETWLPFELREKFMQTAVENTLSQSFGKEHNELIAQSKDSL